MIKLPIGVDVSNLIDDLINFSWEAADVLLNYSDIIKNSEKKINILKNKNINDPVTLADLEVNELIIERINQKYKDVNWDILSEENFKKNTNYSNQNTTQWTQLLLRALHFRVIYPLPWLTRKRYKTPMLNISLDFHSETLTVYIPS